VILRKLWKLLKDGIIEVYPFLLLKKAGLIVTWVIGRFIVGRIKRPGFFGKL